ncbi:hypothetical protein [Ovoidimarina sediminis]|uniref:hypothetical protein n=1 Tax=Ovoidimarina sediminis TaxID=3079856 RepID=UPI00290A8F91|nr:hypothetical protein [Rhodophyticola sp. MJ-SS7]MDU8945586.1 hypothetical protein [Rhodophyticola sp. MJ-SS7]
MFLRALLLLILVAGLSLALTWYFGEAVLLALGLIAVQLKFVLKKLATVEWPAILAWLKTETQAFFQIELLKKWLMTSALPLLVGNALLRRIEAFFAAYRSRVRAQYDALMGWFAGLQWYEKLVAALIVLFATLALSVTSLGLWLILFLVKLPFWAIAALTALGRMIWETLRKTAFKTAAFFQLGWLWRFVRRRLPKEALDRQRRLNFRIARRVVRHRRLTLRQLSERKDSLALTLAVLRERWRGGGED